MQTYQDDTIIYKQDGKTALFSAVQLGYNDFAETLLNHGAKMNKVTRFYYYKLLIVPLQDGDSPLHCFAKEGDFIKVMKLMRKGADSNITNKVIKVFTLAI